MIKLKLVIIIQLWWKFRLVRFRFRLLILRFIFERQLKQQELSLHISIQIDRQLVIVKRIGLVIVKRIGLVIKRHIGLLLLVKQFEKR